MWQLLWACSSGPLELPTGLEVTLALSDAEETYDVSGTDEDLVGLCHPDRQPFLRDEPLESQVVNRSEQTRLLLFEPAARYPDEVAQLGGILPYGSFPEANEGQGGKAAGPAKVDPDTAVIISYGAILHCVDGEPPAIGDYRFDITVSSQDEDGGDLREQPLELLVRIVE